MIGVSSPTFSSRSLEDVFSDIADNFGHWEIVSEAEHHIPLIASRLSVLRGCYDISFSVHAPFCDNNIASLNERMRGVSVVSITEMAEYAADLGLSTITFHPGLYSMAVPDMRERSIAYAKESIRVLERVAEEYGVVMAVENMPSLPFMLGHTAQEMAELVEGTDMPICFDIGHANTVGDIDGIIELLGDRIANVHIHDNDGTADQHRTIGDGNVDFDTVLRGLRRYTGNFIIESRSFESAVESQVRLRSLLG